MKILQRLNMIIDNNVIYSSHCVPVVIFTIKYLVICLGLIRNVHVKQLYFIYQHSAHWIIATKMFLTNRIRSLRNNLVTILEVSNKTTKCAQIHSSSVLFNESSDCLNLSISSENLKFPFVWLRDNCQCKDCLHPSAKSRTIDWSKFNLKVKVKEFSQDDKTVHIAWDDGHKSVYHLNWLKFRSFTADHQKEYSESIYRPKHVAWKGEQFQEILIKTGYEEILKSDKAFLNWLEKLSIYGVALIKNTPDEETAIDCIIKKIGFSKQTHYGVKFIVQNVENASNVAYLSSNLQMHTDLPYYDYCPGVNMLHCLSQAKSLGGENLLSDSHYVANYIRDNHPEQFKLLTDVEVEWSDVGVENGNDFFKLYRSPVICLDKHGEIFRINFSIPQRGHHFPDALEKVQPWYEAHALFYNLSHKFATTIKTAPGDILTFDNIRLLHGRRAYEDTPNNVRKLIGAYVDWDEIYSRLRCLKVKLDNNKEIF